MMKHITAVLSLGLALGPSIALAQATPTISVPYQGRLDKDGAPLNDDAELIFTFTHGAPAATFTSAAVLTTVTRGEFSLLIPDVPSALFADPPIFLTIEVRTDEAVAVALAGSQQILPAPSAAHASQALDDFPISGSLTAPDATLDTLAATTLDVTSALTTAALTVNGQSTLDGVSAETLAVAGSANLSSLGVTGVSALTTVTVSSATTLNVSTVVNGTATFNGSLSRRCLWRRTGTTTVVNGSADAEILCSSGEHAEAGGCDAGDFPDDAISRSFPVRAAGAVAVVNGQGEDAAIGWHCRTTGGGTTDAQAYAYCCDN